MPFRWKLAHLLDSQLPGPANTAERANETFQNIGFLRFCWRWRMLNGLFQG